MAVRNWGNRPEDQRARLLPSTNCLSFFPPLFAYVYAYTYVVNLQRLPKREYSAQIWHYCRGGVTD